jgi:hypothetical protein
MCSKTRLNFINRSYDVNRSDISIFQSNEAARSRGRPIVWKVIRRCPIDWSHPFTFSSELRVGLRDRHGNRSPGLPVAPGRLACVSPRPRGGVELLLERGDDPASIHVENRSEATGLWAEIYRDGRLLSRRKGLAPRARAVFRFGHRIYLFAASGIDEGDLLRRSDLHWRTVTGLDLHGVTSADIVMTGGGYGPRATPLRFHLHRVEGETTTEDD